MNLVQHALDNVWGVPYQDKQYALSLVRFAKKLGVQVSFKLFSRVIPLPHSVSHYSDYWHVYSLGAIGQQTYGLNIPRYRWVHAYKALNHTNILLKLYTLSGYRIPLYNCYLLYTHEDSLVIAVRRDNSLDYDFDGDVYAQFYDSSYFRTERLSGNLNETHINGIRVSIPSNVNTFVDEINTWRNIGYGAVNCYINGKIVNDISIVNAKGGDYCEYVFDGSVSQEVMLPIEGLLSYTSTLDNERKHFVHWPLQEEENRRINYNDDVEIQLVRLDDKGGFKGVYYHRNTVDAIRNVTHRDYAVPVKRLTQFVIDNPDLFSNNDDITLRIHIRNGGYEKALIRNANRMQVLYKLSDDKLLDAVDGVNALIKPWQLANLENSAYCDVIRAGRRGIDLALVEKAYGYYEMAYLLGNSPIPVVDGNADLPSFGYVGSTIFEYNKAGHLSLWRHHGAGVAETTQTPEASLIECMVGRGTDTPDNHYNTQQVQLKLSDYAYRMYKSPILDRVNQNAWEDVTGSDDYTIGDGGLLTWNLELSEYAVCVRSDKDFLLYEFDLKKPNHDWQFDIMSKTQGNLSVMTIEYIPYAQLDVFVKRDGVYHALQRGLDYYVQWPKVVVTNKEYLTRTGETQRFLIRAHGLAEGDLSLDAYDDKGFVINGIVSCNGTYNLRQGKVMQFFVDGRLVSREALDFDEDTEVVKVSDIANGRPFFCNSPVVPLRDEHVQSVAKLRSDDVAIDKAMSEYMSQWAEQGDEDELNIIPQRYMVHSPIMNRLTYDFINGVLSIIPLMKRYDDNDVHKTMERYKWLLPYEPLRNGIDERYVDVQPHDQYRALSVSIYAYNFLERVNRLYFDNKINLNKYYTIALADDKQEGQTNE